MEDLVAFESECWNQATQGRRLILSEWLTVTFQEMGHIFQVH
jgi:hypothetical protein